MFKQLSFGVIFYAAIDNEYTPLTGLRGHFFPSTLSLAQGGCAVLDLAGEDKDARDGGATTGMGPGPLMASWSRANEQLPV